MKLKNLTAIQFLSALQKYMDKKLPQKISYAIQRNAAILTGEYEFYQKQYQRLIEENKDSIETDVDGKLKINENGIPEIKDKTILECFINDLQELLNCEIDKELYQIEESAFAYNDDDNRYDVLSPADINNLILILCNANK